MLIEGAMRKGSKTRRFRGGGLGQGYTLGAPLIPGVDTGISFKPVSSCMADVRPGMLPPTAGVGLPGMGGGGRRKYRRRGGGEEEDAARGIEEDAARSLEKEAARRLLKEAVSGEAAVSGETAMSREEEVAMSPEEEVAMSGEEEDAARRLEKEDAMRQLEKEAVSGEPQSGGRYTADLSPLTGAAPWAGGIPGVIKIPCENSATTHNALNTGTMIQRGGVGGIDSARYLAPTAGYSNSPSTWVGATGSPYMLQTPYAAGAMNPACLTTGGGRRRRRKTNSKKSRRKRGRTTRRRKTRR